MRASVERRRETGGAAYNTARAIYLQRCPDLARKLLHLLRRDGSRVTHEREFVSRHVRLAEGAADPRTAVGVALRSLAEAGKVRRVRSRKTGEVFVAATEPLDETGYRRALNGLIRDERCEIVNPWADIAPPGPTARRTRMAPRHGGARRRRVREARPAEARGHHLLRAAAPGGSLDAFVTKLNASGSALDYSTLLGGTDSDEGLGIAVRGGRAYVTGGTSSSDYPTTPGAFDTSFDGPGDAFVTKLNASGSALDYSTLLGGTGYDQALGIAVRGGRTYVTGFTASADYPTTPGAFDRTYNGFEDAFVTKLPTG